MWKKFIELSLRLYDLIRTVDSHTKKITELERQVVELQQSLREATIANEKDRERWETERSLLLSRVENLLLRHKLDEQGRSRELPPVPASSPDSEKPEELPPPHNLNEENVKPF